MAWRCNNCRIVYDDNPEKCEKCGSTILDQVDLGGTDKEVIMGENVKNESGFLDKLKSYLGNLY